MKDYLCIFSVPVISIIFNKIFHFSNVIMLQNMVLIYRSGRSGNGNLKILQIVTEIHAIFEHKPYLNCL